MKAPDSKTVLRILEEIYNESPLETQCSLKDISNHLGCSYSSVYTIAKKLETLKIISCTGKCRSKRFHWNDESFKPTEALAIRLGAVQVLSKNRISEFTDTELISELKSRGYLIYKEM